MQEIEKEFKKELAENIQLDEKGVVVKADSLGSLEALLTLLRQENIHVLKAGIGSINKQDISAGKANLETDELNAVVLGFNVELDEEAKEMEKEIRIITDEVVYKLIENLKIWQEEKRKQKEKEKLMSLAKICKLKILHNFVFHNSKPAIFGVKVEAGKLEQEIELIDEKSEKVGRVKNIQHEKNSVKEASPGMEVAISLPGVTFDRQLKETNFLYSNLSESQFRDFKKNKSLLSSREMKVLQEIAVIKRKEKATWGI